MGQDAGQIIGSLNRNTAAAHQAVGQLDVAPLEGVVHNRVDMINDLSDEGLGYFDKIYKIAYVKKYPEGEVEHDENGNVLYATDKNGNYIKDSYGRKIPLYHYLTPEEEKHLQKGSDGKVHMFYNGILPHQMMLRVILSSLLTMIMVPFILHTSQKLKTGKWK
ncbi:MULTISPECIES: hypothetical protein [unclassified Bartonella]|uniref:hypothetical protein n=1 Tax=unclassified Bartonella TaxID=2645622 RepID=UPI0035CEBE5B